MRPPRTPITVVRSPTSQSNPAGGSNNASGGLLGNESRLLRPQQRHHLLEWNHLGGQQQPPRRCSVRKVPQRARGNVNRRSSRNTARPSTKSFAYLSPHRKGGPVFARRGSAPTESRHSIPGDAKLCDSLSNAIYTAILSRKADNPTKANFIGRDGAREEQKAILDADWKARTEQDPNVWQHAPRQRRE